MKNVKKYVSLAATGALMFTLSACAPHQQNYSALEQQKAELSKQQEELDARQKAIAIKEQELEGKIKTAGAVESPLLPPNAKAGECYARVFVPPAYKTITESVLKEAESTRIEIIPATYKTVEQKVLVSEESEKKTTIPAKYEVRSETVLVSGEQLIWKTSLDKGSAKANEELLASASKHGIDLDAAQPGECFHEHYLPPTYETVVEDELVAEESYRIEVVPAKYETVEEKVLVSEATKELVQVSATYKWVEEKILVKEAHTAWKKGRGLTERVDNTTGEIMCLVEVPAEYKIVRKKVVDKPASTVEKVIPAVYKTVKVKKLVAPVSERKVAIPAQYRKVSNQRIAKDGQFIWHEIHNKNHSRQSRTGNQICLTRIPAKYRTVTKKVMVEPARTVAQTIPAQYKTVKVQTVATPAQERKIVIPAEYQQLTRQEKVSEGVLEWRQVLCETNTTPDIITKLQNSLIAKGYNPGPVDGVYGVETERAVKKFQKDNSLATGGLTYETMKKLNI